MIIETDSESDTENQLPTKKKSKGFIKETNSESDTENQLPPKKKFKSSSKCQGLTKFEFSDKNDDHEDESFKSVKRKLPIETKSATYQENIWNIEGLDFDFLKPGNVRDAKKRRPDDPNYDPKTIYVPESYLSKLTPAMRQWWTLKMHNNDCLLFFKVGKFYELYYADAVTAIKELNISMMKGNFPHCGFPEQAYDKMVTQLIEKGYKVARVEQTETPSQMEERVNKTKKPTKFDKVS